MAAKKWFEIFVVMGIIFALFVSTVSPVSAYPGGNGNGNSQAAEGQQHRYDGADPQPVCRKINGQWQQFVVAAQAIENGQRNGWGEEGVDWYVGLCQQEQPIEPIPQSVTHVSAVTLPSGQVCFTEKTVLATGEATEKPVGVDVLMLTENEPANLTNTMGGAFLDVVIRSDGCQALATYYRPGAEHSDIVQLEFYWEGSSTVARVAGYITSTMYNGEEMPEYGPDGSVYFVRHVLGGPALYNKVAGVEILVGVNIVQAVYNEQTGQTAILFVSGEARELDLHTNLDTPSLRSIAWGGDELWGIDRTFQVRRHLLTEPFAVEAFHSIYAMAFNETGDYALLLLLNSSNVDEQVVLLNLYPGGYEQMSIINTTGYDIYSVALWTPSNGK